MSGRHNGLVKGQGMSLKEDVVAFWQKVKEQIAKGETR
jgi:hypothetical protein